MSKRGVQRFISLFTRPYQYCKVCSYSWQPRGRSYSIKCPNCGSRIQEEEPEPPATTTTIIEQPKQSNCLSNFLLLLLTATIIFCGCGGFLSLFVQNVQNNIEKNKTVDSTPIQSTPAPTLFVIHMGSSADGYFEDLVQANNSIGLEMKWTIKSQAKTMTRDEAEKVLVQMQRLAKMANMYAPLKIEPADEQPAHPIQIAKQNDSVIVVPVKPQQLKENKIEQPESKVHQSKYETRQWKSGDFTCQATFLGYFNGIVTIKKEDGKEVKINLEMLSNEDQNYVNKIRGVKP